MYFVWINNLVRKLNKSNHNRSLSSAFRHFYPKRKPKVKFFRYPINRLRTGHWPTNAVLTGPGIPGSKLVDGPESMLTKGLVHGYLVLIVSRKVDWMRDAKTNFFGLPFVWDSVRQLTCVSDRYSYRSFSRDEIDLKWSSQE